MAWPTTRIPTASLDAGTDRPQRGPFLAAVNAVNQMIRRRIPWGVPRAARDACVCELDADGLVPAPRIPTSNAALTGARGATGPRGATGLRGYRGDPGITVQPVDTGWVTIYRATVPSARSTQMRITVGPQRDLAVTYRFSD